MKNIYKTLGFSVVIAFMFINSTFTQGVFFKQYWADSALNSLVNNTPDRLVRVNDKGMSVHERFAERPEAHCNGLILINISDSLHTISHPSLYLEMWGGHAHTANKRFTINGKETYMLPEDGTKKNNCAYPYPEISLKTGDLVCGVNAIQFTCDRGKTFWGHYIVDQASIIYNLKPNHPDLINYSGFNANVHLNDDVLGNIVDIQLDYPKEFEDSIVSVEYFGKYFDYDDDGDFEEYDWHGYTYHKEHVNNLGKSSASPFNVSWNTEMIPTQKKPIEIKARINFKSGLSYWTPVKGNFTFSEIRDDIKLYYCSEIPKPFWSRDHKVKEAVITLPKDLSKVEKAQLIVRIWDGGEGNVKEPFKLNDKSYKITAGDAPHEVVYTIADVEVSSLVPGKNKITLISDTEHHGIEVLLPGPALMLKFKQ